MQALQFRCWLSCAVLSLLLLPTGVEGNPRVDALESRVTRLEVVKVPPLVVTGESQAARVSALESLPSAIVQRVESTCIFDDASTPGNENDGGFWWTCVAECPTGKHAIGGGCAMDTGDPSVGDVTLVSKICEPDALATAWDFSIRFNSVSSGRTLSMEATAICADTGE